MTKTGPEAASGAETRQTDILEQRVREAESRTLDYWLEAVTSTSAGSMTVKRLEQSLSWRITKPLRAFRIVQITARRAGLRRTAVMVRTRLAQIRQARERG
jgi:hypothetical protein